MGFGIPGIGGDKNGGGIGGLLKTGMKLASGSGIEQLAQQLGIPPELAQLGMMAATGGTSGLAGGLTGGGTLGIG